jgi:hypothetical protein
MHKKKELNGFKENLLAEFGVIKRQIDDGVRVLESRIVAPLSEVMQSHNAQIIQGIESHNSQLIEVEENVMTQLGSITRNMKTKEAQENEMSEINRNILQLSGQIVKSYHTGEYMKSVNAWICCGKCKSDIGCQVSTVPMHHNDEWIFSDTNTKIPWQTLTNKIEFSHKWENRDEARNKLWVLRYTCASHQNIILKSQFRPRNETMDKSNHRIRVFIGNQEIYDSFHIKYYSWPMFDENQHTSTLTITGDVEFSVRFEGGHRNSGYCSFEVKVFYSNSFSSDLYNVAEMVGLYPCCGKKFASDGCLTGNQQCKMV